jgi:hypothetical protein
MNIDKEMFPGWFRRFDIGQKVYSVVGMSETGHLHVMSDVVTSEILVRDSETMRVLYSLGCGKTVLFNSIFETREEAVNDLIYRIESQKEEVLA